MKVINYSIFGFTIATDFAFISRLNKGYTKPNIYFKIVKNAPIDVIWSSEVPKYSSSKNKSGKRNLYVYHLQNWDVLRFIDIADYYINNQEIICHLHQDKYYPLIEIQFLGSVLSYWLERHGIPTIHASAVYIDGKTVAFLSSNKGGKTSIAASLMQNGFPLITDDIMPLDLDDKQISARSGYPTMRMWPDEAKYFLGHSEDLPLVHPDLSKRRVFVGSDAFGRFYTHSSELKCIYIPKRSNKTSNQTGIEIKPVPPVEGVLELVRHSFTPYLVEAMGWQHTRLEKFAKIIAKVPVKKLIYPSGYENLPHLCESILDDINRL